ncbi:MAG TPA: 2-amino-4-hydroxy-6-hydroxymethyldihydropteridine diphosphokinase [Tepidisphaeraceae bacterium]|jgi:2-amino-4-hydroxy-6-hydroxymethyldihydropteridine diphosphokinase
MRTNHQITAFIGLGANLGDRQANVRAAIERLKQTEGVEVTTVSNLLENPAVGMEEDAPPFLNGVARVQTSLGSHALLHRLLEIEREMGRHRGGEKWLPRTIDLDLLLYGDHIISSQELIVPHPLMHERRFVLEPLAEIAPDVVHPTLQMTIAGLLENLSRNASATESD